MLVCRCLDFGPSRLDSRFDSRLTSQDLPGFHHGLHNLRLKGVGEPSTGIYLHTNRQICMYLFYVYTYRFICTCMYACKYGHVPACVCVCMCVHVCVRLHPWMYECTDVWMYGCMYSHGPVNIRRSMQSQ